MDSKLSLHSLFNNDELIGPNINSQYQKLNIGLEPNLAKKFRVESSQVDYDPNRLKTNEQLVADQDLYMITPCNFSICDTTIWVLDIGSPVYIYKSLQGLQVSTKFENGERFLNVGDGSQVSILALGVVKLIFKSNSIILSDCHYCPSFLIKIISVGLLAKDGYSLSIKNDYYDIIMNDVTIMQGQLRNHIYILSQPMSVMYSYTLHS